MKVDHLGNTYIWSRVYGLSFAADYLTLKFDSSGDLEWSAVYNGDGDLIDIPHDLIIDDSLNVYVTGESPGNGTGSDYATIKINNSTGATVWASRFNGPCNGFDAAVAIAVDEDGNVYVTGQSKGDVTDVDYATLKLNNITGAIQ